MSLEKLSAHASFGGEQGYFRHASRETKTSMRFSVFTPPQTAAAKVPVLFWLSGLTCTEDNFTVKAGAQRVAAELGIMVVAPDTSPRGPDLEGSDVPDDPDKAYDFGLGAGFYVDATQAPWSKHYRMCSYCARELPDLIAAEFPAADLNRAGIFGHSMGGHGALTIGLKNPDRFKSISAFAPIVSPINCPWGEKALGNYIGADRAAWRQYDACALIEDGRRARKLLVDQGDADQFLASQLKPEFLKAACDKAGVPLTLRMQPGYDHSYFFIASFIEDHLRWHDQQL
jgi:S-formylglutathione hydrolase